MGRNTLNFLTDSVAAATMLGMVASGIILRFALPPGSTRSFELWGLTRHQWGDLHFWLAIAALGVVIIHLALHWTWIVSVVRRWFVGRAQGAPSARARTWAAVATVLLLILCVGGFWKLSVASVVAIEPRSASTEANQHDDAENSSEGERVRGSMTLAEVAEVLGCSTSEVRTRLGVSDETADTERLGQIAKQQGVDMQGVRRKLEAEHN